MSHMLIAVLIFAGVFGSKVLNTISDVDRKFAIALQRGTDSDWTEFCYAALEAKSLSPEQKKYMNECEREINLGGIE